MCQAHRFGKCFCILLSHRVAFCPQVSYLMWFVCSPARPPRFFFSLSFFFKLKHQKFPYSLQDCRWSSAKCGFSLVTFDSVWSENICTHVLTLATPLRSCPRLWEQPSGEAEGGFVTLQAMHQRPRWHMAPGRSQGPNHEPPELGGTTGSSAALAGQALACTVWTWLGFTGTG